jgi:hypothetical protein
MVQTKDLFGDGPSSLQVFRWGEDRGNVVSGACLRAVHSQGRTLRETNPPVYGEARDLGECFA